MNIRTVNLILPLYLRSVNLFDYKYVIMIIITIVLLLLIIIIGIEMIVMMMMMIFFYVFFNFITCVFLTTLQHLFSKKNNRIQYITSK